MAAHASGIGFMRRQPFAHGMSAVVGSVLERWNIGWRRRSVHSKKLIQQINASLGGRRSGGRGGGGQETRLTENSRTIVVGPSHSPKLIPGNVGNSVVTSQPRVKERVI